MKQFEYIIKDENGIHARPAGLLVKQVKPFASSVTIKKDEKSADAKKLFALMGLCVKHGDKITVTVEGADENEAAATLEEFFQNNL